MTTPVPEADGGADVPRLSVKVGADGALAALGSPNADRLEGARSAEIAHKFLRGGATVVFNGSTSISGDMNVGGRGNRSSARASIGPTEYSDAYLDDYTSAYVQPDWYDEAFERLVHRKLLVVSGPTGTGRYTAALHLLRRVLKGAGPVRVRQLPVDICADPTWTPPMRECGYVVLDEQSSTPKRVRGSKPLASAEVLDDVWLTRARELLNKDGSFLVVVTGPPRGKLAMAAKRHEFVLENVTAPSPHEVFEARLRCSDLKAPGDVLRELRSTDIDALLRERPRPRFAVRAAAEILTAVGNREDLAAVVAGLRDPQEQVAEWFGDTVDPAEIAFAVATSVLEGCGYLTVSDGAADLHRKLAGKTAEPVTHMRRLLRSDHPWIELATGTGTGAVAGEIVRFRNADLRLTVLSHAWHELDGMRDAIQEWLRDMAGHSDVEVRARAATAAGFLARGDFQHALHTFLLQWAGSDLPEERHSAALALGVVGLNDEYVDRVWQLLGEFAEQSKRDEGLPLPQTAALAAGGLTGLASPLRALWLLRELLAADDWSLLEPAALSVARLVEDGADVRTVPTLRDWTDAHRRGDFAVKVLIAFVIAARPPKSGRTVRWPVLLRKSAQHYEDLPVLWARALCERRVRPLALDVLREWLRLAEHDHAAYDAVLDVLAGITDLGERESDDLLHQLELWAEDWRDPSHAAARAHDDLVEAEEALR
ncbi:hypothetical protein FXN61_20700 [Lentzea sp. PSKA42]|uniref:Uncharacterized protein n=1 Tax=Lentzea indica TaxID=2604800 RepID=A0ABX1FJD2_9PSEU|nr:hypothetical protein [Lentzea indica]NKE59099.1 hypothetical protein [Lentzea indica]